MTNIPLALDFLLEPPVLYRDASTYDRLEKTWFDTRELPTEAEIDQAIATLKAREETGKQQANAILGDIRTRLQNIAGKSVDELTNADLRDLVFAMAFESGAIDRATATIKNPSEWVTKPQE